MKASPVLRWLRRALPLAAASALACAHAALPPPQAPPAPPRAPVVVASPPSPRPLDPRLEEQRTVEVAARNALHDSGLLHHRAAAVARSAALAARRCALGQSAEGPAPCVGAGTRREREALEQQALRALERANAEYAQAVLAYETFLTHYPNDESAYELRYLRAEALYWSGHHPEAARAFGEVRDTRADDRYLAEAAYLAVRSFEAALVRAVELGQLEPCHAVRAGITPERLGARAPRGELRQQCSQPPSEPQPAGSTQRPTLRTVELPGLVRELLEAQLAYGQRVPAALDTAHALWEVLSPSDDPSQNPPLRHKFAYVAARTLARYGHVAEAERALRALLAVSCDDALAQRAALFELRDLLVLEGREQDLEVLARQLTNPPPQACRPTAPPEPAPTVPREFILGLNLFRRAERASGPEVVGLYEQASREMLRGVRLAPAHPQAPLALFYAALGLERAGRSGSATRLYLQVLSEYNHFDVVGAQPPRPLEGEDRAQRVNLLEFSTLRAAVNLERACDFEQALRYYAAVAADPRFASAREHRAHLHDALASIALLHTNLGHYAQAREAWLAFLPYADGERERALARYRVAEMPLRAGSQPEALAALREYRRSVPLSPHTAEHHLRAQYELARLLERRGDTRAGTRELREVVALYRASGLTPSSPASELAAEALLADLESRASALARRTYTPGAPRARDAQRRAVGTELAALDSAAQELGALRGEPAVTGLLRAGQAWELEAARLEAQEEPPAEEVEAARARAVQRYALAVLRARREQLASGSAATALERIHAPEHWALLTEALAVLPRDLRGALGPSLRPGAFEALAPGATLTQGAERAVSELALE